MRLTLTICAVLLASTAIAQHRHGQHAAPYAGFQSREIKALSAQEIADLRAGRGMGLALAAELNSYPGPMHVLEHADALRLTAQQRQTMEALMATMRRDAIAAGEALISAEAALDRLFATASIDDAQLASQIRSVALAQGEVRRIHLATHIRTRAALTPEQIAQYNRLRGYTRH